MPEPIETMTAAPLRKPSIGCSASRGAFSTLTYPIAPALITTSKPKTLR